MNLRHRLYLVLCMLIPNLVVLDSQLHHHLRAKMKIVKKAAAMLRSKTCVLGARLLVLASPRRRMAAVVAVSHANQALVAAADVHWPEKAGALVLRKVVVDLSEYDHDDDGGCPDWTHSLFNNDGDNCCCTDEYDLQDDGDYGDDDYDDDEPSVMDVIRSNREVEGLEFNMDDEIDQASGMFIRRFRERMSRSL